MTFHFTPVVLFTGIMTSTKYVWILEEGLLPFISDYRVISHGSTLPRVYNRKSPIWFLYPPSG